MNPCKTAGRVAGVLLPLLCAPIILAQESLTALKLPDFTATQIVSSRGSAMPSIKVFRSGLNLREQEPGFVTLYLPANDEVYELLERAHACIKMRTDQVSKLPSPMQLMIGSKVERTPAGTETVEQHTCKVENVVVTNSQGKTIKAKVWEAEDLQGIPVKIEVDTENGPLTATFRDIVAGTPDPELFKPPSKCTPFEKRYTVME